MQILKWQKRRRDWGGREKRTTAEVLSYFELPFQGNGNSDWSPTCQSAKTKTAQSQRSAIFTAAFSAHGEQTRSVNCTPLFQMVFKEANCLRWNHDYILGRNMSFFRTIGFLVREDERTISVSLPGL